jgi:hypothetical protein
MIVSAMTTLDASAVMMRAGKHGTGAGCCRQAAIEEQRAGRLDWAQAAAQQQRQQQAADEQALAQIKRTAELASAAAAGSQRLQQAAALAQSGAAGGLCGSAQAAPVFRQPCVPPGAEINGL